MSEAKTRVEDGQVVVDFDHNSTRFRLFQHEMDVAAFEGALAWFERRLLLPARSDDSVVFRLARVGTLCEGMAMQLEALRREKAEALSGLEAGERELVGLRTLDESFGRVLEAATNAGLLSEDDYPEEAERTLVEYFQCRKIRKWDVEKLQDALESLDGKLPRTPGAQTRRMIALMRKGKKAEASK